ncbi:MAG: hypothetical protein GKS03_14985 [Alphaproteobacteria bacterium]|nr:hypothetical protein [Alphaproteobacteria bacterium]
MVRLTKGAVALLIAFSSSVLFAPTLRLPEVRAQDLGVCRFERSVEQGLGGTGISTTDVLSRLTSIIPIEQGVGGTGLTDTGSRGLGGTGVIAFDERGIGGTAVIAAGEERGLGGTGIIGLVTGFASICVNGYEVEVTADTAVSVEGFAGADGDIQLGQLVAVEAYPIDGTLVASSVAVQVAVAGPVESIDADRSTLSVAGQTVAVSGFGDSVDVAGLETGSWIVVSGLRRADDVVVASSIQSLATPGDAVLVSGPVRATSFGDLRVGEVTIAGDGIAAGDIVVARGTLENAQLTTQTLAVRPALPFSSGIQTFSVLGFPEAGVNGALAVGGVPLPPGPPPPAQQPVQIDGTVEPNGALNPASAAPPPQDGAVPNPPPPPPNGNANGGGNGGGQGNGPGNGQGGGVNGPNNPPPPPPPPNGNGNGGGNGPGGGNNNPAPPPAGNNTPSLAAPSGGPATPSQPQLPARPQQAAPPDRPEQPARPEAPARPERPERPQTVDRPERPERPQPPARPERPERPPRPQ